MNRIIRYNQPRARYRGESLRPDLWPDHAWQPNFGISGVAQDIGKLCVHDVVGAKHGYGIPHASDSANDAILPSYVMSDMGYVLQANQAGSYGGGISCGVSPFGGLTAMSFELLFKKSSTSAYVMIAEDGTSYIDNSFFLSLTSGDLLHFEIYTSIYSVVVSDRISAGIWHHIVCTWSVANGGYSRIYVNGVKITSETTRTTALYTGNANLCLFGRPNTSNQIASMPLSNGSQIAYWRCYKRELQHSQVLDLYADPMLPFRRREFAGFYVPSVAASYYPHLYYNRMRA